MSKVISLHDSSKEHSGINAVAADKFISIAGKQDLGSEVCGLQIKTNRIQNRYENKTEISGNICPNMLIDSRYLDFYSIDKNQNESYSNLAETLKRYNEVVQEKFPNDDKYILKNIPSESPEFKEEKYYEGYKNLKSCIVMNYTKMEEDDKKYSALVFNGDKYAILNDLNMDERFNTFGLNEKKDIAFDIEDIQEALDKYEEILQTKDKGAKVNSQENSFINTLKLQVKDIPALISKNNKRNNEDISKTEESFEK